MSDFNSTLFKILGERIRKKRLDVGLNQEDVAKEIGMGRASVSNIEVGRQQAPLSVLYEISRLFKTDIQLLLPTYQEVLQRVEEDNRTVSGLLEGMPLTDEIKAKIQKIIDELT
jgi:transcriptional regulator with XRE-family HTH domain